ncbi:MAG: acyl phosphate:glycerol-3-phosphate acyltransferase [Actinomycetota bacterium]|jgi:glycerol-3-phosphate acyltransferase PlsY|nr:acyl phosphate:glycerol-3-phosphate acyltransferase [Actinomycetota bacterium]
MHGAGVVAAAIAGYLLGSVPSADLAGRLAIRGGVDLRSLGSRNPGATNAAKVLGPRWGAAVLLVDVAKGVAAGFAGGALGGDVGAYLAATAVIAGHILPPWSRFRGGKGVATAAGAVLAVFPAYFPIFIALAAVTALATRSAETVARVSGAAWIIAAVVWWTASLPNGWGPEPSFALVAFSVAATALILVKFALARREPQPA